METPRFDTTMAPFSRMTGQVSLKINLTYRAYVEA